MGWTTVTNSVDPMGLILFALLFVWQLPHFLSISMVYQEDYEAAGIKIYPTTSGVSSTKVWISIYTILLFATSLAPYFFGYKSFSYLLTVSFFGLAFSIFALIGLLKREEELSDSKWAKSYFWGSLIYLPAIMSGLLVFK
jgi:protoheme IX farnesyltransferase